MHRNAVGRLHDQTATSVDNRRRVVVTFFDIGRIGTFHQRQKTLVGDRLQGVEDHLDGDRVRLAIGHVDTSISKLPAASTVTRSPG